MSESIGKCRIEIAIQIEPHSCTLIVKNAVSERIVGFAWLGGCFALEFLAGSPGKDRTCIECLGSLCFGLGYCVPFLSVALGVVGIFEVWLLEMKRALVLY
jgi:hypothetical protein